MQSKTGPAVRGMVDPAGDDPAREWGYSPKALTWIGVPFQPHWTQVTFDGALYSLGQVELCFFHGRPPQPLLARQKTYLEGWIPVVQYDWREGSVQYAIELFAAALEGEDATNTVNFVRVEIVNHGPAKTTASFTAALRNCGEEGRWLQWSPPQNFRPDWRYEMTQDAAIRDGRLVYTFSPGAVREAVPGVPYAEPFLGSQYHLTSRAEACLARYAHELAPGETKVLTFRMPRVPVLVEQTGFLTKLRRADHDAYRQQTVDYWRALYQSGMQVEIPEPRVQNAFQANLVHLAIANRDLATDPRFRYATHEVAAIGRCQTSGINYPDFFCNDYVDIRLAWDVTGHAEYNAACIDATFALCPGLGQREGGIPWPHWGQVIHSLAHHYLVTGDEEHGRRFFPHLCRMIEILQQALDEDRYGLVPECGPYDNEMIQGHYTSHNLWCLLGLRSAIRLARGLGEHGTAAGWLELHDRYLDTVRRALAASAGDQGHVPPGLYDYRYGQETRGDVPELVFHNEWENSCLVWPTEVLAPLDPLVTATLAKIHRLDFREGVLGYHNAYRGIPGDIHGYSGHSVIWQLIARGDQAQALTDLYHVLLHCGSTHEIWEQGALSWTDRESVEHSGPHTWASARTILTIRNLLVMELGGSAGIEEGERDLHLFSGIAPTWARPGQQIAFRHAVTEMGRLSATLRFTAAGAELEVASDFQRSPRWLVLHLPYFVELEGFETDASRSRLEEGRLLLSPEARRVTLRWHERAGVHAGTFQSLLQALRAEPSVVMEEGRITYRPAPEVPLDSEESRHEHEPLSFRLVLEAYRHEYARRYRAFVEAGGVPVTVAAPPLLTAQERRERYLREYGEESPGDQA
ncbi:MAG: hypothetical protein WDA75_05150 [Candidatus Latescibacterota bacterium]|jgi:hypothetical protein